MDRVRLEQMAMQMKQKQATDCGLTILITGASSGIGLAAAKLLAAINPIHRIILVCRTEEKADLARQEVLPLLPSDEPFYRDNIIGLACDHCSLQSIRTFNEVLRKRLDETYDIRKWAYNGIDVLCLNAAVLMAKDSDAQFTKDGLEVTFQTNYLAPFLIANLTMDLLNPHARVVLSTSGLHERTKIDLSGVEDPMRPGRARKGFAMVDGKTDFHYKQSYAVSKLCMVALCAELHERLNRRSQRPIVVNCFSPGLMTTSGLFRHQRQDTAALIPKHNRQALKKEKSVCWGAGALVFMCVAKETGQRSVEYWRDADASVEGCWSSIYGEHFCPTSVAENIDPETRQRLWKLSNELVGLEKDE